MGAPRTDTRVHPYNVWSENNRIRTVQSGPPRIYHDSIKSDAASAA